MGNNRKGIERVSVFECQVSGEKVEKVKKVEGVKMSKIQKSLRSFEQ